MEQCIKMKMLLSPEEAITRYNTGLSIIRLAINGGSFFKESAGPGNEIIDEFSTFDQCSGHPQKLGLYHYYDYLVCLIKVLEDSVTDNSTTVSETKYT